MPQFSMGPGLGELGRLACLFPVRPHVTDVGHDFVPSRDSRLGRSAAMCPGHLRSG